MGLRKDLVDLDFYLYDVTQKELQNQDLDEIICYMELLIEKKRRAFQKAAISFQGYDDVTTEVYEVPEVRQFIQKLFEKYPYLFYFMNPDSYAPKYLMLCLVDFFAYFNGEKPNADEILEKIWNQKKLPNVDITFKVPENFRVLIVDSLLDFGKKIGDVQGAVKTVQYLKNEVFVNLPVGNFNPFQR